MDKMEQENNRANICFGTDWITPAAMQLMWAPGHFGLLRQYQMKRGNSGGGILELMRGDKTRIQFISET